MSERVSLDELLRPEAVESALWMAPALDELGNGEDSFRQSYMANILHAAFKKASEMAEYDHYNVAVQYTQGAAEKYEHTRKILGPSTQLEMQLRAATLEALLMIGDELRRIREVMERRV